MDKWIEHVIELIRAGRLQDAIKEIKAVSKVGWLKFLKAKLELLGAHGWDLTEIVMAIEARCDELSAGTHASPVPSSRHRHP